MGVAFGLLGLIAGVGAWFRPAPKPEAPVYSAEQVADAKKAVCAAFENGQTTLAVASNKTASAPTDEFEVTINSRLAVDVVMDDLRAILTERPEAPESVITASEHLVGQYQQLLLNTLADKTAADLNPIFQQVDQSVREVRQVCK